MIPKSNGGVLCLGRFQSVKKSTKIKVKLLSLILKYLDSPQITFPNPILTLLNFLNLLTIFSKNIIRQKLIKKV
jgi:hypothetical protein